MYRFEELQALGLWLWTAASGSNFEAQLSGAALQNGFGEPFGEQVCRIAALGHSFGEQLWGTTLGSSAGEQLWVAALWGNFGQLSDQLAASGSSNFGEAAFRSFGATGLENSFGHNFVEQRRGTAFGEQL